MTKAHPNSYRVVAWSRDSLRGTYNRIIATGYTKTGALKEYHEHMARFPVSAPANYIFVELFHEADRVETLA